MIKQGIKYLIRSIGLCIGRYEPLKKIVHRLLDRTPDLKVRLIRIVKGNSCTDGPMRYEDLSLHARAIYRQLVGKRGR